MSSPKSQGFVWVSRPHHRAAGLAQALTAVGFSPHIQPALCITDLPTAENNARRQLANQPYDIVIFISAEAANRFADLRNGDLPSADLHNSNSSFAALSVGGATAAAVQKISQANLICTPPAVGDSEQLLLLPILQSAKIHNKRILVVGGIGEIGGADIADVAPQLCGELQARGAVVITLPLYCRAPPLLNKDEKESLQKMSFCAAVAYSSETATNMLTMTKPNQARFLQLPLFVIHSNIAAAAAQCGWQNPIVAPSDDEKMAQAISDYLQANR